MEKFLTVTLFIAAGIGCAVGAVYDFVMAKRVIAGE